MQRIECKPLNDKTLSALRDVRPLQEPRAGKNHFRLDSDFRSCGAAKREGVGGDSSLLYNTIEFSISVSCLFSCFFYLYNKQNAGETRNRDVAASVGDPCIIGSDALTSTRNHYWLIYCIYIRFYYKNRLKYKEWLHIIHKYRAIAYKRRG